MSDSASSKHWTTRLDTAVAALQREPVAAAVIYDAMALAWHTAGRVGQPTSPLTALNWLRLTECLWDAWDNLITVVDPPWPAPFDLPLPAEPATLADSPQVHAATGRLLRAAADATRALSDTSERHDPDGALTLAITAASLANITEDWP